MREYTKREKLKCLDDLEAFIVGYEFNSDPFFVYGICATMVRLKRVELFEIMTGINVQFPELFKVIKSRNYKGSYYTWKPGSRAPRLRAIRKLREEIKRG